jgi:hypothetical protein
MSQEASDVNGFYYDLSKGRKIRSYFYRQANIYIYIIRLHNMNSYWQQQLMLDIQNA